MFKFRNICFWLELIWLPDYLVYDFQMVELTWLGGYHLNTKHMGLDLQPLPKNACTIAPVTGFLCLIFKWRCVQTNFYHLNMGQVKYLDPYCII